MLITQAAAAKGERRERAPGDLLEIWAEKLVYAGYTAQNQISQLKKGALLSDFSSLINSVRTVRTRFEHEEQLANMHLGTMRQEVQGLLGQLEASYYASKYRGRLVTPEASQELRELARLAMEVPEAKPA